MLLRPDLYRRRSAIAWLAAISAVGLALRLAGIQYGLPDVHNPDEIAIMSRALGFAKGDLNPHNFLYPTLYFYVLFGWVGASFAAGWVAGLFPSVASFQTQFFLDPTYVYTAGRLLSVAFGVATIAATHRLARSVTGDAAATWTAAALMAVAPFAVRDAHYVKHDVPVTLAAVAALLAMARWRRVPTAWRRSLLAGVACGVACSTHYYAVFLVVPLVAIPWVLPDSASPAADRAALGLTLTTRVRLALVALLALVVTFFVCSPFLLVEAGTAWQDMVANRRIVVDRAVHVGWFGSAGTYARMMLWEAMGWPAAAMAAVGTVALIRRDARTAAWLLAFPVPFLLFIANTVPATRYLNPVLPVFAVLAAAGVSIVLARVRSALGVPESRLSLLTALSILAVIGPGLADSVRTGVLFRQTDTRTLAADYIRSTVPPGATVLTQAYTVQLAPTRASLVETLRTNRRPGDRPSARMSIQLGLTPYPSPAYRMMVLGDGTGDPERLYLPYDRIAVLPRLDALRDEGVEFVVIKAGSQAPAPVAMLRSRLGQDARRLMVFSPYRDAQPPEGIRPFLHNADARLDPALARPGPVVEVWQLLPAR